MPSKPSKKVVGMIIRSRKTIIKDGVVTVRKTMFYCYYYRLFRHPPNNPTLNHRRNTPHDHPRTQIRAKHPKTSLNPISKSENTCLILSVCDREIYVKFNYTL